MLRLPVIVERNLATTKASRQALEEGFIQKLNAKGIPTTCKRGCSHCCKHPLLVSILEGAILYRELQNTKQWTLSLKRRLEEHSKQTLSLAPEVWMLAGIPCPLLEENSCTMYSSRPFSCRTLYSSGDPDLCTSARFSLMTPLVPRTEEAEAFRKLETQSLREAKLPRNWVPISTAILVGKVLCEEEEADTSQEILRRFLESA